MAAIGAYTNPTWVDGSAPALSASNLQALTDQVKNITDAAVSGGASPTKIWTSTNDGNAGKQPAPKYQQSTLTPGFFEVIDLASGASYDTTIYGGTVAYMVLTYGAKIGGLKAALVAAGSIGPVSANATVLFYRIA